MGAMSVPTKGLDLGMGVGVSGLGVSSFVVLNSVAREGPNSKI